MSFIITKEQNANALAGIIKASQGTSRSKSKLSIAPIAEDATEPPKTRDKCPNKYMVEGGRRYLLCPPDCPDHGSIKENASFSRPNNTVIGAGRDGRRKVCSSD